MQIRSLNSGRAPKYRQRKNRTILARFPSKIPLHVRKDEPLSLHDFVGRGQEKIP